MMGPTEADPIRLKALGQKLLAQQDKCHVCLAADATRFVVVEDSNTGDPFPLDRVRYRSQVCGACYKTLAAIPNTKLFDRQPNDLSEISLERPKNGQEAEDDSGID
jgi:hypothetical protein